MIIYFKFFLPAFEILAILKVVRLIHISFLPDILTGSILNLMTLWGCLINYSQKVPCPLPCCQILELDPQLKPAPSQNPMINGLGIGKHICLTNLRLVLHKHPIKRSLSLIIVKILIKLYQKLIRRLIRTDLMLEQ